MRGRCKRVVSKKGTMPVDVANKAFALISAKPASHGSKILIRKAPKVHHQAAHDGVVHPHGCRSSTLRTNQHDSHRCAEIMSLAMARPRETASSICRRNDTEDKKTAQWHLGVFEILVAYGSRPSFMIIY